MLCKMYINTENTEPSASHLLKLLFKINHQKIYKIYEESVSDNNGNGSKGSIVQSAVIILNVI